MPFPAPCRAWWEFLGLRTHPIYPALEYVCRLWRKCTRPEALSLQTVLVVLFLCFPKGRVSPSPGGGWGLPPWAAVCPCPVPLLSQGALGHWQNHWISCWSYIHFHLFAASKLLEAWMRKQFYPELSQAFLKSIFISPLNWRIKAGYGAAHNVLIPPHTRPDVHPGIAFSQLFHEMKSTYIVEECKEPSHKTCRWQCLVSGWCFTSVVMSSY